MSEKLRFNGLTKVWNADGEACEFVIRLQCDRAAALSILNSGIDDAIDLRDAVSAEVAEALATPTDLTKRLDKRRSDLAEAEGRLESLRNRLQVAGVELRDAIEIGDMSAADTLQGELSALPLQISNSEQRVKLLQPLVRESEKAVDGERQRIEASIRKRWGIEMEQARVAAKLAIGAAIAPNLLSDYYAAARQASACGADWQPASATCPDTPAMKRDAEEAQWQRQRESLAANRAGNDEERRRQEQISRDAEYYSQTPGSWLSRLGKLVVG